MNHLFLKSDLGESPVTVEAEFRASTDRIFRAWTTPEEIKKWFGSDEGGPESASVDLKVGGKWEFIFPEQDGQTDGLSGTYLDIQPGKLLVFSWVHTRSFANGEQEVSPESKVSVNFEAFGEKSLTRIVHESISSEGSRVNIGGGWNNSLQKMHTLIEA